MLKKIQLALDYLIYFFTSDTKYDIHSPFVFDFVTRVVNVRKSKPAYHSFELIRSKMLKSKADLEVLPLGAGNKEVIKKPIRKIAANSSKSARYAELLERICEYFQPEIAIELGTSLGISAMYQASALREGFLLTLEGNPDSAKVAQHNFDSLGFQNIQLIQGDFEQTLPAVLQQIPRVDYVFFDGNHSQEATLKYFEWCLQKAHEGTVFVFDDIRWSDEMLIAWKKICKHPQVTLSIDMFMLGLVFFRKGREKEDFVVRF